MTQFPYKFERKAEDITEHIKFLRSEFGPRGEKWDYVGTTHLIEVMIADEKLATYYAMRFDKSS